MNLKKYFIALSLAIGITTIVHAQAIRNAVPFSPLADTFHTNRLSLAKANDQLDLIDLVEISKNYLQKSKVKGKRQEKGEIKSRKLRVGAVPAAGYTLQTGFAVVMSANGVYYTNPDANASTLLTSFTYTARNQIILPFQYNLWTKNNKYNIFTDWRFLKFPSYTYGIGGYTNTNDGYLIYYNAIRLHETALKNIGHNMYVGLGYDYDYFYDILELDPPKAKETDLEKYGYGPTETASGFTFNFLYDSRENSVNPDKGNFVNVIYRPNFTFLGNTTTWRSLVIDMRKYIRFPKNSDNVIALWSYEWLTLSGNPPYLMLPSTGSDAYSNTGRGYIQGRYRGKNMAYLEGEYRFEITNNGLIGGVIFGNAESFTELTSGKFETVQPGWGMGVRVKLNKFSKTNIAVDYGFGLNGSGGVFVNVGEVF